jgi:hypothetical protein
VTEKLTALKRVLEKPIALQPAKKFSAIYES